MVLHGNFCKVQRLSRKGVHASAWKWEAPQKRVKI
nr:MAG TPA: hypothetical protein [Caudoviricetes sp.]